MRVSDQFPAVGADAPLEVAVGAKHLASHPRFLAVNHRSQALPFHFFGNRQRREVARGGKKVQQVAHRIRLFSRGNPRSGHQQRHANAVVVQILLPHQAMPTHCQAVVSREDDDGVLRLPGFVQRLQDPPNLGIQMGNHRVVVRGVPEDRFRLPWKRGQQLVANF